MGVLVHVYDLRSARVGEYRLDAALTIGKDPSCNIVLPSPYISARHAELTIAKDEIHVRALGFNGVFVNDLDVTSGSARAVKAGDVISVPGYVLYFTGLADAEKLDELELERQFSDLKRSIHQELLADAALRGMALDADSSKGAQPLRDKLAELLDRPLNMTPALVEYIVKKEVRERVVDAVVRGGIEENSKTAARWSMSTDQVALDQFVATCLYDVGVKGDLSRARIADVRDKFGPVFDRHKRVLGPNQMSFIAKESIRADIESLVFGLGPLEDLLRLPDVTEIMVVGKNKIFIEKGGGLEETGRNFPTEDDVNVAVNRMVRPIGRAVNRSEPIVDARLDGRLARAHRRAARRDPRHLGHDPPVPRDAVHDGGPGEIRHARPALGSFLRGCILARKNMVISGGTGSGKTTLLNVLGAQIPFDQRLVVIEDSAELQLPQPNLVNLEARKANLEGKGEISIKDLVRSTRCACARTASSSASAAAPRRSTCCRR